MTRPALTALCLAMLALPAFAPPAAAQEIHPERSFVLRCHFTRSCISGGCGEEDYDTLLEVEGAGAIFRDAQVELALTGGFDPATGQLSFASEPVDEAAYFFSDFGDAGAILSIHTQAEGQAIGITFDGKCYEEE